MTRRLALAGASGTFGALALIGLSLGIVTWAQGPDHALELLWDDRLFLTLISAGFGTQVALFTYVRLLQRDLARTSIALAGAGTATSSVSMVACCAHHLADVLPLVGLSGLAVLLVELRTPLMLIGLSTNVAGIALMLRELRRTRSSVRPVAQRTVEAEARVVAVR